MREPGLGRKRKKMIDKIRQMRGIFTPPISQQLAAWFYFVLFVILSPALFLSLVFCKETADSSDSLFLVILALAAIALGLLLFLKTGVKYDFSTTHLTVKNQIGFSIKKIGYHEMITATTQADHGMIFLVINSQCGNVRLQLYKGMIDRIETAMHG
jgi:hypothetical protein